MDRVDAATTHEAAATQARRTRQVRHYHHGRSPAAWTGVAIALVGFLVATASFFMGAPHWLTFWIGMGLIVLSVLVGGIMKAAGLGNG